MVTYNGDMRKLRRERMRQAVRRRENFRDVDARPRQRMRYNPLNGRVESVHQEPRPTAPAQGPRFINFDIRVHPNQWGVNDGDRNLDGRDFRPAQHRPPQAHWRAPVGNPASPADHEDARAPLPALAQHRDLTTAQVHRLRDIRDLLRDFERALGSADEDNRIREERERRQEGRRGSRGRGTFASGRIAPRESTQRLERQHLIFEAAYMLDAAHMSVDELMLLLDSIVERPESRDPFYSRNRDPDDEDDADYWHGGGGGSGAGGGGPGYGGGGGAGMGGGNAIMV